MEKRQALSKARQDRDSNRSISLVVYFIFHYQYNTLAMASWPLTVRALLAAGLALCVFHTPCIGKKKPPAKPVNINTATSEELQQVPGIGPATAQKILQMRKSYGPFKSVDDLLAIRGLGQKRLDKMRKYLTVGKASSPKKPQPPAKDSPNSESQPPPRSFQEPSRVRAEGLFL